MEHRKESTDMSFVAMIHNQNGIATIADSKSTIVYPNHEKEEELNRPIQKVFYNNRFILLTFGKNQVDLVNGNYINLEDVIHKIMEPNMDSYQFFSSLHTYILAHQRNDFDYCFSFIVGEQLKEKLQDLLQIAAQLESSFCQYSSIGGDIYCICWGLDGKRTYINSIEKSF